MSLQNMRWIIRSQELNAEILNLSRQLNFLPEFTAVLYNRGIRTFEDARRFFKPKREDLYDPYLLKDLDKAVEHLINAMKKGFKIMFYGDYDVDGTTSVALMSRFFKEVYSNFVTYIPDRYTEGYGLTPTGIDYAKKSGVDTIVALDCGIKSIELAEEIRKAGMHLIIIDHHTPGPVIPEAAAVVDAKRPDCTYPFDELSACAVAFKVIWALSDYLNIHKEKVFNLLDLVAVSIGADMVPLRDENRILMKLGLDILNDNPKPGFSAIIKTSGIRSQVTSHHVGFVIGPRINAAGRIDHAHIALDLLTTDDMQKAFEIADHIERLNSDRKEIQDRIAAQAIDIVRNNPEKYESAIVICGSTWLKGVVGIVAARLVEEFYKPSVVCTESHGKLVGSARSIQNLNIYDALEHCREYLCQFGGHSQAAGVTLLPENFERFSSAFSTRVSSLVPDSQRQKILMAEAELLLKHIDEKFIRLSTQHIQPTGFGNPTPLYASKNLTVLPNSHLMGRNGEHIRLFLSEENSSEVKEAVWFSKAQYFEQIKAAKSIDVVYRVEINEYNNQRKTQLKIEDIALSGH
ncbi:MAG: single-stranded-DNA-specific exonuclease RecJ [Thermaurantimonas sp.]